MSPEHALYMAMIDNDMAINPGTVDSLREAIESSNIHFFDDDGVPSGFVTWYFEGNVLVVNNLCMFSRHGVSNLLDLKTMLHEKYPDLEKVMWWDTKHKRPFEAHFGRIENGQLENESNIRPVSFAENSGI